MTRAIELAYLLQISVPHQEGRRLIQDVRFSVHHADIRSGSLVESGFEPGILLLRGRDLTTRPQQPVYAIGVMPLSSTCC
ncbi:hypothetical protein AVEN_207715-1 [Araneus ventricosus]|uniref:Uncharacterized protein n=1 Tax=Araneus ventricosus TaxID=182803 RepID=A0A4Y2JWT5_ARAVE|nr:hypothetical protein AVEN_172120-1 [Araneus ventricosus]GBM94464.1 hypothetical protein AVEN_207715-1 [Araneus ventricosus]